MDQLPKNHPFLAHSIPVRLFCLYSVWWVIGFYFCHHNFRDSPIYTAKFHFYWRILCLLFLVGRFRDVYLQDGRRTGVRVKNTPRWKRSIPITRLRCAVYLKIMYVYNKICPCIMRDWCVCVCICVFYMADDVVAVLNFLRTCKSKNSKYRYYMH